MLQPKLAECLVISIVLLYNNINCIKLHGIATEPYTNTRIGLWSMELEFFYTVINFEREQIIFKFKFCQLNSD